MQLSEYDTIYNSIYNNIDTLMDNYYDVFGPEYNNLTKQYIIEKYTLKEAFVLSFMTTLLLRFELE